MTRICGTLYLKHLNLMIEHKKINLFSKGSCGNKISKVPMFFQKLKAFKQFRVPAYKSLNLGCYQWGWLPIRLPITSSVSVTTTKALGSA
jgi:hypothetical protein